MDRHRLSEAGPTILSPWFSCGRRWFFVRYRGLFWLVLFIFFTFSFVVLFEYGTHDFTNGFKQEAGRVKNFCVDMVSKPKASPSPGAKKR